MLQPKPSLKRGSIGLADLVEAHGKALLHAKQLGSEAEIEQAREALVSDARQQGFALAHKSTVAPEVSPRFVPESQSTILQESAARPKQPPWKKPLQMPFVWMLGKAERVSDDESNHSSPYFFEPISNPTDAIDAAFRWPEGEPATHSSDFSMSTIRGLLDTDALTKSYVDWASITDRLARRASIFPLPGKLRKSSAPRLALVFDFRSGQADIYIHDAKALMRGFRAQRGAHGLEIWQLTDDSPLDIAPVPGFQLSPWDSSTVVLVFSNNEDSIRNAVNFPFRVIPWNSATIQEAHAERLMQALSMAVSIEPRFIRQLRLAFVPQASAALEWHVYWRNEFEDVLAWRQWRLHFANPFKKALADRSLWSASDLKALIALYKAREHTHQEQQVTEELSGLLELLTLNELETPLLALRHDIASKHDRFFYSLSTLAGGEARQDRSYSLSLYAKLRLQRLPSVSSERERAAQKALFKVAYLTEVARIDQSLQVPVELSNLLQTTLSEESSLGRYRRFGIYLKKGDLVLEYSKPNEPKPSEGFKFGEFAALGEWLGIQFGDEPYLQILRGSALEDKHVLVTRSRGNIDEVVFTWNDYRCILSKKKRVRGLASWWLGSEKDEPKLQMESALADSLLGRKNCLSDGYGLYFDLALRKGPEIRFRYIEPGTFQMGSTPEEIALIKDKNLREWATRHELPQHTVHITEGFWMAETPITVGQWNAVMPATKKGESNLPVTGVKWSDAAAFMKRVQEQLPKELAMTFPTEAQWEYACRADSASAYSWGNVAELSKMNVSENSKRPTPVKVHKPNAWGLYGMHGNVWEWCLDQGLRRYKAREERNPVSSENSDSRVFRGGSWGLSAGRARAASRAVIPRGRDWFDLGFRPVLRSLQGLARQEAGSLEAERGETPSDGPPKQSAIRRLLGKKT